MYVRNMHFACLHIQYLHTYIYSSEIHAYSLTHLIEPTKRKKMSYRTEEEENAQNEKEKRKEKELVLTYIHTYIRTTYIHTTL